VLVVLVVLVLEEVELAEEELVFVDDDAFAPDVRPEGRFVFAWWALVCTDETRLP
jgi:hypothetical protein